MKYEIKSRKTGKVVYEAEAKDVAADWNTKKRLFMIGQFSDKKLNNHVEKHDISDLYLEIVEVIKPTPKPKVKKAETEIIEPEVHKRKKPVRKKK